VGSPGRAILVGLAVATAGGQAGKLKIPIPPLFVFRIVGSIIFRKSTNLAHLIEQSARPTTISEKIEA
jgi:hypothetical protein